MFQSDSWLGPQTGTQGRNASHHGRTKCPSVNRHTIKKLEPICCISPILLSEESSIIVSALGGLGQRWICLRYQLEKQICCSPLRSRSRLVRVVFQCQLPVKHNNSRNECTEESLSTLYSVPIIWPPRGNNNFAYSGRIHLFSFG